MGIGQGRAFSDTQFVLAEKVVTLFDANKVTDLDRRTQAMVEMRRSPGCLRFPGGRVLCLLSTQKLLDAMGTLPITAVAAHCRKSAMCLPPTSSDKNRSNSV